MAVVGGTEISRFLVVGGVNFVFTLFVFTIAMEIFDIGYVFALLLAWISGNVLTYVLNFIWVFHPEEDLIFGYRFLKYLTAGFVSIASNMLVLMALVEFCDFDPFYSQIALIPFVIIFNFSSAKFWSLRKKDAAL